MTEETTAAADPRIVLVEDDATIAGMYRYHLEQEGHTSGSPPTVRPGFR